jgi:uncharacterized membrane protein YbhN (UPF0104 family)
VAAPRLVRQIVVAAALGAAVTVGLTLAASLPATLAALAGFRWGLLPLVLAAVLVNWALRFAKWHYYLGRLAIPLPWGTSALVFLSGFTMAITPAKVGEVLKALLVRDRVGTEVGRTASVVMAERLTDVVALLLLSALGLTALPQGRWLLAAVAGLLAVTVLILKVPRLGHILRDRLPAHPLIGRAMGPLRTFVGAGRVLLAPGPLAVAVLLSVVSWFFECLALYLVLHGLDRPIGIRAASFLYAFASLAGAVSMLPGGLGVAEGSLTGLLVGLGTPAPDAVAATLLVRAVTLWLAVGIGVMILLAAFRPHREPAAARDILGP